MPKRVPTISGTGTLTSQELDYKAWVIYRFSAILPTHYIDIAVRPDHRPPEMGQKLILQLQDGRRVEGVWQDGEWLKPTGRF